MNISLTRSNDIFKPLAIDTSVVVQIIRNLQLFFVASAKKHGIPYSLDDVFKYIYKFESKTEQLSIFDI